MPGVAAVQTELPAQAALTRARTAAVRFGAGAVALAAADVAIDPTRTHVPLCPLHSLTGLWCPFCGGLRAVAELAHGHLGAALRDNALLVAALPVLVAFWLASVRNAGWDRSAPRWPRIATVGAVVLVVSFSVVRNMPFATALRPGH